MAKIITSEFVTIRPDGTTDRKYNWQGIGIAYVPDMWLRWVDGTDLALGKLNLRIVDYERFPGGAYVVRNKAGWQLWAAWYHLWRFLCWFERNLRLTARIWGLLKHNDPACEWRWRDFVLLWLVREWRRPKVFKSEMLDDLVDKKWLP